LEIIVLRPDHVTLLAELFARISADPLSGRFHPHPFSGAEADRICNHQGHDRYLALRANDRFLAYGMLRGWDEGFSVPSLGIYVAPELRGSGASRLITEHLHLPARLSCAMRIPVRVYSENVSAYNFYLSLGYRFSDPVGEAGQLVGFLELS